MTTVLLLAAAAFASLFAIAGLSGAPWVPSRTAEVAQALARTQLGPGKTFCDLGCGTGTTLVIAARTGARVRGVELNPILWAIASLRLARTPNAHVHLGSFWRYNLSDVDVAFIFSMPRFMDRIGAKFQRELRPGAQAVSYTFEIPGRRPLWHSRTSYIYKY